jgi:Short C-terminal domain
MGLFKKLKEEKELVAGVEAELAKLPALQQQAMEQAQALMGGRDLQALVAQAMSGAGPTEQLAYREQAMKLMQHGVEAKATVHAVRVGAPSPLTGRQLELEVSVTPASGAPYDATIKQYFPPGAAEKFAAGSEIPVRVDPDDPQSLLVWGSAESAAAPTAESSRLERLEKLGEQRKSGAMTEEEFQRQKAAILAET